MQTYTSREFNQYTSRIQKHARQSPVIISNRGKPDQVLMSYSAYQDLVNKKPKKTIADALSGSAEVAEIDFDPPRVEIGFRPVEF